VEKPIFAHNQVMRLTSKTIFNIASLLATTIVLKKELANPKKWTIKESFH
jgi:hypothetical protein